MARTLKISQPHLHNVLKGARKMSFEFADQAMREFGISIADLLSNDRAPNDVKPNDVKPNEVKPGELLESALRKPSVSSTDRKANSGSGWHPADKRRPA